jgi:hypothetical protein
LAKNNSRSEIRLLSPQRVPLSAEQYDEAVSLLAELLLDAAEAKRRGVGYRRRYRQRFRRRYRQRHPPPQMRPKAA